MPTLGGPPTPRSQALFQFFWMGLILFLAMLAVIWANNSGGAASHAQNTAVVGVRACRSQVANYHVSVTDRLQHRAELKTLSSLHRKTARVFDQLANLSRRASEGQTKILDLALAYSQAAGTESQRAAAVRLPVAPTCGAA